MNAAAARARVRRLGFHVAAIALVLATMEAVAFLVFTTALRGKHFRYRDLDAIASPPPTQGDVDWWRTWGWDRELGWLRRPGTRETVDDADGAWTSTIDTRGARSESFAGAGGLVSAYGDSFTFGHEVGDDETWPHYLSARLATRVDNWGQSAWGPDQAVLRLRRNLPEQRTDVVVLAVMSENIARLLNCYRPFLTADRNMRMAFKPMVTVEDGSTRWLPNPLARSDTPADYGEAFARATEADYWYAENQRRVRVHFPYLLRLPAALAFVIRQRGRPNLYREPAAVERLDAVIEEFRRLAREHAFVPVLLFLPEPTELERFAAGTVPRYRPYLDALRARSTGSGLVVVDLLDHPFEAARFNRRPFKDHPSPYGNQVIATTLQEVIAPLLAARSAR